MRIRPITKKEMLEHKEELGKWAMEYFNKEHKKLTPKEYALYMWEELRPYIETDPRVLPQKQEKKINKYKDWRKYEVNRRKSL